MDGSVNSVKLTFQNFQTESIDYLRIYNGINVQAGLIGSYSCSTLPSAVTASNNAGALTLVFTSDGSVTSSGFLASISCTNPNAPNITSVFPGLGGIGAPVLILGTNLGNASSVKFNGMAANVVGNTTNSISTTVPLGASSGYITATNTSGTGQSPITFRICPEFITVPGGPETVSRCGGGLITLNATGSPFGNTYRWYTSSFSSNYLTQGQSYSTNIVGTTSYFVSFYNSSTGCQGGRKQVMAKVNAIPIVSFSGLKANYCQGEPSKELIPQVPGGVFAGVGVIGNQFNPLQSGSATITYTVSQPPCPAQTSQTTTVSPTPAASFLANGNVLSSTTSGSGLFYQWLLNGVSIPSATNSFFTLVQSGSYQLVARIGNCSDTSDAQIITDNIELINGDMEFTIFPNPTTNWVHIKSGKVMEKYPKIHLSNSFGQELNLQTENVEKDESKINLESIPAGFYFLRITLEDRTKVYVVQKE